MALSLKSAISLSNDGITLSFYDKTNAYSAITVGGYGSPNQAVSDATAATVAISLRAADGTFGTATTVDVFSTLPSNSGGYFDITATVGAGTATWADGIYKFVYTVSGTSGGVAYSTSVTRYETLRNSIANCYQTKAAAIADCSCACKDIQDSFKCFSLYMRLLKSEECCGNLDGIQKYLTKLTSMCSTTDCNCS